MSLLYALLCWHLCYSCCLIYGGEISIILQQIWFTINTIIYDLLKRTYLHLCAFMHWLFFLSCNFYQIRFTCYHYHLGFLSCIDSQPPMRLNCIDNSHMIKNFRPKKLWEEEREKSHFYIFLCFYFPSRLCFTCPLIYVYSCHAILCPFSLYGLSMQYLYNV